MDDARNTLNDSGDIPALMVDLGQKAKAAARVLAQAPTDKKNAALFAAADAIRGNASAIKDANAKDMAAGKEKVAI